MENRGRGSFPNESPTSNSNGRNGVGLQEQLVRSGQSFSGGDYEEVLRIFEQRKLQIYNHPNEKQEKIKEIEKQMSPYDWRTNQRQGPSFRNLELRAITNLENDTAVYEGQWNPITEEREGMGIQVWSDGSRYEGCWKQGMASGHGRLIHASGDVFEGEWLDDMANGYGFYTDFNGSSYDGYWLEDKHQGHGVEQWPDGTKYEGEYINGMKHGQGQIVWSDLSSYKGEFLENDIHGQGVYTWADGRQYSGQWNKNKMDGYGSFTWKDGRSYVGDYKDDLKHGYGTFTWPDDRKYEGNWDNGKQHGQGTYYKNGTVTQGVWHNGKKLKDDEEIRRDIGQIQLQR